MLLTSVLGLLAILFVLARELWLHVLLASVAQVQLERGYHARAQKLFERIVRSPSLLGARCAPSERYRLAWCYLSSGRPEDAARECRTILSRRRSPTVDAMVRRRLADALEAAGQLTAAEEERRLAAEGLQTAKRDADFYLGRGRELASQRKYAEACECYRSAVELIPQGNDAARAETMVRLSLACFNAGFHSEAADWAEQALKLSPSPHLRLNAHNAAAIGYSSQGQLDEAEQHHRKAYELATAAGTKDKGAKYLASLAAVQRRQGKLVEAVRSCEEATAQSQTAWRIAGLCEAEALKSLGRFDQARAALARAQRAEPLAVASEERRAQGTLALGFAHLEGETGQPEAARQWLQKARQGLEDDERLLVWVDAVDAWLSAALGRSVEAEAALADIERRQAAYADDRTIWRVCTSMRARTLSALGQFSSAREAWEACLQLNPDPIDQPTAHYHRGECCRELGDLEGARRAYQEAQATGIDSYDARLAKRRLEELDGSSASG